MCKDIYSLVQFIRLKNTENGHSALESRNQEQISNCVPRWGTYQGAVSDLWSELGISLNNCRGSSAPCKSQCYQVIDSTEICRAPIHCTIIICGAPDRIIFQEHHSGVRAISAPALPGRRVRFQCFCGVWIVPVIGPWKGGSDIKYPNFKIEISHKKGQNIEFWNHSIGISQHQLEYRNIAIWEAQYRDLYTQYRNIGFSKSKYRQSKGQYRVSQFTPSRGIMVI